jgi:hypothetical protein
MDEKTFDNEFSVTDNEVLDEQSKERVERLTKMIVEDAKLFVGNSKKKRHKQ